LLLYLFGLLTRIGTDESARSVGTLHDKDIKSTGVGAYAAVVHQSDKHEN